MQSDLAAAVPGPSDPTGSPLLLEARDITKQFEGLIANRDIDFEIPRNAIVSIIGPNGAGKTTFFNQLTGIYAPTSGRITFDGIDITGFSPHEVAELGIGRTYQNIRLFQNMTVLANIQVGRHVRMKGQWFHAILGCAGGSRMSSPRTFPMATSVAWRWLAPSPATPSCSCWMSQPPA
jgi:branched-chain amino acid transport system ATP-binding protein